MPKVTNRSHLIDAMRALRLTQVRMADRLGVSQRTLQRWGGELRYLPEATMHGLARELHPIDPNLAAEIALLAGTTPESLGLETRSAASPTRAAPTVTVLVDSVVCAAAEAASVVPATIRPALHAALIRCAEVGLSFEELEQALRPAAMRARRD